MDKSPVTGAVTPSVTDAVWLSVPLVPVMVNGKLPVGVDAAVVTVKGEDPDVVIDVGLKAAGGPAGKPLPVKLAVPVNPPEGGTGALQVVVAPWVTVCDAGVTSTA